MNSPAIERFFLNQSDGTEREMVIQWLLNPEKTESVKRWMRLHWDILHQYEPKMQLSEPDIENMWLKIQTRLRQETGTPTKTEPAAKVFSINRKRRITYWAAASLIFFLLVGNFSKKNYTVKSREEIAASEHEHTADLATPENVKAVLLLANRQKIYLDSTGNGILVLDGNVKVEKKSRGELVYSVAESGVAATNTLVFPQGSKPLRPKLADGSLVLLKSAYTITYPMAFSGKERKISRQAEAYFEVAKNANQPLIVESDGKQVRVLGTHFNVNAYGYEKDMRVTLLEGSVQTSDGCVTGMLKPGLQAMITC